MTARAVGAATQRRGIHQQRRFVDLHIRGHRACRADRRRRVHPGVGDRRNRVAGPIESARKRELERIGAVADGDALGNADVCREFALEGLHFRAQDVPAAIVNPRHRGFELRAQCARGAAKDR